MSLFYDIMSISLLSIIAFQDFKYKAVSWMVFPALFLLFVLAALEQNTIGFIAEHFLLNMVFVLFQLLMVTVYFSIKSRKIINIERNYLGSGDILFFIVLAVSFSFLNFVFVYILSLIAVVAAYLFYRLFKKNTAEQIPLAGGMAVLLAFFYVLKIINMPFNFHDDSFALELSSRLIL
ncbi:MAG: hypothetical protein H0V01_04430 [Bacteroidetes bacterium]|nr:hypothetical protein [Bacteroidota bacterium]HET6243898.1 hypothetical protein [Bacteroidia bacterium]